MFKISVKVLNYQLGNCEAIDGRTKFLGKRSGRGGSSMKMVVTTMAPDHCSEFSQPSNDLLFLSLHIHCIMETITRRIKGLD